VPAAITFLDEQKRNLDPRSPEGLYNQVMAKTGSVEAAEKAMTKAKEELKLASLQGATL
jgi:hypothetical protein